MVMMFVIFFMYVCVCLFTCVFFSFVQPYSCGPQSCRHSVREDRVIHRHERGGPSVHISKQAILFYSILFQNIRECLENVLMFMFKHKGMQKPALHTIIMHYAKYVS